MKTRSIRLLFVSVLGALAVALAALEFAHQRGWLGPLAHARTVAPPIPYYTPLKSGDLRFLDISDERRNPPYEPSEPAPPYDSLRAFAPDRDRNRRPDASCRKWEKYEARFDLSWQFANPYDPDEIAVDALVQTPSGRVEVVPAFWYVPCTSGLVNRTEPVRNTDEDSPMIEIIRPDTSAGPGTWMLRYAPREEGRYRYQLVARTPTASAWSQHLSFDVDGTLGHGFARVSLFDPRYFECEDGSFLFLIGENVAWPNDAGSADFARYMANLHAVGANFARIWLTSYFEGQILEWSPVRNRYCRGLGFYSPEMAWKLDQMLELAEQNDVRLLWCLQHHGQFSTRYDSCWDENPYNIACGGFLAAPQDFFTDARAKKLFRQRLRYIVARYGYSPGVFGWEFWNEVDLTDRFSAPAVTAWHHEMAEYLRSLDPTFRPVTTSYVDNYNRDTATLPSHDFTQVHIYHSGPIDWINWSLKSVQDQVRMIDGVRVERRPVLIAEYGLSHRTNYFRIESDSRWPVDPDGLNIHDGLWIGLFSASAGTAMPWWWDRYLDRNNLYFHFTGISRFLVGEDLRDWGLRRIKLFDSAARTPDYIAYVLAGPQRAYGWIYESGYTMQDFNPPENPRTGVRIALDKLADGECWIEFWDTYDGVVTSRIEAAVVKGKVAFVVPAFRGDIAFKLFRGRPTAEIATPKPAAANSGDEPPSVTPIHDRMIRRLRDLAERFHPRETDLEPPQDQDLTPRDHEPNDGLD